MNTKTKKKLSLKAIRILRRVQKRILAEPDQFEMNFFFTSEAEDANVKEIPNCGTAACIAGWVIALTEKKRSNPKMVVDRMFHGATAVTSWRAQNVARLRLGFAPSDHLHRLFYVGGWPDSIIRVTKNDQDKDETKWRKFGAMSKRRQANLAVKRIEHFIKTDGVE